METAPMKKYLWLVSVALLTSILLPSALAADITQGHEKVIWINQLKQVGQAYEGTKKIMEFPVLTGDDETTTDPGIYVVRVKDPDYYSRKYQTPMRYSLFFDYAGRKAIHEGEVPPPKTRIGLATHGCIHVEEPYMEKLYDWAEAGKTMVVIMGWRTED
jgi:lipoprotein-anchoring transpeptidase ErfK/SrfK